MFYGWVKYPAALRRCFQNPPLRGGLLSPAALLTLARSAGFLQPGFLHERLAEHVFFFGEDFFEFGARGELVLDDVFSAGDADFIAGAKRPAERPFAVDLDAVGTVEVTDVPHTVS